MWCPKALARIGDFSDTISDRSIIIRLSRKTTDEKAGIMSRYHKQNAVGPKHAEAEERRRRLRIWLHFIVIVLATAVFMPVVYRVAR